MKLYFHRKHMYFLCLLIYGVGIEDILFFEVFRLYDFPKISCALPAQQLHRHRAAMELILKP